MQPLLLPQFHWSVTNAGATWSDAGLGSQLGAGGTANTKNATKTQLLAGASVTEDIHALAICFNGGAASASIRQFLTDLYVDESGGTTWEANPRIANLIANSPSLLNGGYWYFFPLHVKAGSSIGAACQCNAASATMRMSLFGFGLPERNDVWRSGKFVRTFGANTGTSGGTALTPGTSAVGAYSASLGAIAAGDHSLWWWQAGLAANDTTQSAVAYLLDVAAGDGSNKVMCAEGIRQISNTSEQSSKDACGMRPPIKEMLSGANVYLRATGTLAPDASMTGVVYGVGG